MKKKMGNVTEMLLLCRFSNTQLCLHFYLFLHFCYYYSLFTPILLPLSLNTSSPIITHSRDFPILLSLLILTSTILQPYRFWMTYLFLIGISPWFAELWSLFQRFLSRFHHTLRTHVPIIYITCVNQNQEMHPDEEIEMQDVQGDELHFEQQNCLEVVIDG